MGSARRQRQNEFGLFPWRIVLYGSTDTMYTAVETLYIFRISRFYQNTLALQPEQAKTQTGNGENSEKCKIKPNHSR